MAKTKTKSKTVPATGTRKATAKRVKRTGPSGHQAGKTPKTAPATKTAPKPRTGTKQALLVAQLQRKEGATIAELVKATGWQAHSVRGAISGSLKMKLGLAVSSEKFVGRGRVYHIAERR